MEYFQLIRKVLKEERVKGGGTYYEAHHIIPQSFNKKSSTVLLTPEEHYQAHKLLAEYWKGHSTYANKMYWAYHRMAFDKGREISKEEFGEARRILAKWWSRPKSEKTKQLISKALKGNTNNSSRVFKGMKSDITEEGRKKLANLRKKEQTGKKGLKAKAAKGPYTVIFEDGRVFVEGSYPELVKVTGLKYGVLQHRVSKGKRNFLKGWKILEGVLIIK